MHRVGVLAAFALVLLASELHADTLRLSNRSVSCGSANRGKLSAGTKLPARGYGYVIPAHWRKRNYNYGTDQLVGLLKRAARKVANKYPGAILGVADLSKKNGGTLYNHHSHQSGRDVDLLYYAIDRKNRPFKPDKWMPFYRYNGRAYYAKLPYFARVPERFFDLRRNWALVKALLTDPRTRVTHIFASYQIKIWLLKYARRTKEPRSLIARAIKIIMQPSDSVAHNDHMHVRVACRADDVRVGHCRAQNWPAPRRLKNKRKRTRLYYWRKCPAKTNS